MRLIKILYIVFFCNIKYKNKKISVIIINKYINNDDIQLYNNILINNEKIELDSIIYKSIENNMSIINLKNNNNKRLK